MSQSPFFAVATALACLFGSDVSQASAQAPYGAFVIRNDSNVTIRYDVKWGENGAWQSWSVAPYSRMAHYHPLDSAGRAPAPYVRFDFIGGDGQVTYKTYRMEFYAVYDYWQGFSYVFRYHPGGVILDLYRE